ncbi:nucleotidyltransferase domain-containing protein [Spirosoma rhododendri]|uniref:Nucleotidyltransferase domain-containing protein n=1 Tax=Spirosoma rhododendri TaxID=2728024 RepID=A0A7L5DL77_9BACT|nr:nucleotidyltransferase domain-containing protein [Spirosoma rhododendri]QJD79219.1 nucleotidyltransferase domain-containing protein [Spirosoma rhododendri]
MQLNTSHVFQSFVDQAIDVLRRDTEMLALAVGGSWTTARMDTFSDLDLVLVSTRPIAPNLARMRAVADKLGVMLSAFRGDHVGEPRLLIALYDNPLLHVDIKFLTTPECYDRVEDPVVVWERDRILTNIIQQSSAYYPGVDFTWIEDRFWIWVHYALLKIGRGEYFEALDFLSFLRSRVIGPLIQLKNGQLPNGVRRIEMTATADDLENLRQTVATPTYISLVDSLKASIRLYTDLRNLLAPADCKPNQEARQAVEQYMNKQLESTHNAVNTTEN